MKASRWSQAQSEGSSADGNPCMSRREDAAVKKMKCNEILFHALFIGENMMHKKPWILTRQACNHVHYLPRRTLYNIGQKGKDSEYQYKLS